MSVCFAGAYNENLSTRLFMEYKHCNCYAVGSAIAELQGSGVKVSRAKKRK